MSDTVQQYFTDNPEKRNEVVKANYAYHTSRTEPKAHYFQDLRPHGRAEIDSVRGDYPSGLVRE